MNSKVAKRIRNSRCDACRLCTEADEVCITGTGNHKGSIMVVGRMPNSPQYQASLEADLSEAGINVSDVFFTSAVKCRAFETTVGKGRTKSQLRMK